MSWRGALVNLIGRGRAPVPALLALLVTAVSLAASRHDMAPQPLVELVFELPMVVLAAIFGWRVGAILLIGPLLALVTGGGRLEDIEWLVSCLLLLVSTSSLAVLVERFRVSQAHLRAMLRPMTDVILTLDREGRYLAIAPTSQSLLIGTADSLIGKRVADVFPEALAADILQQIHRALESDASVHYEYTIDIDGTPTAFSAIITAVTESSVVCVARDVTTQKQAERIVLETNAELEARVAERTRRLSETVEALNREVDRRKAAEDALLASKERYRSIVDQSSEIIYTISAHGVITSLNPAFEQTLGWSADAWIGRFFADLVAPDQPPFEPARIAAAPLGRTVLVGSDGRHVAIETSLRPKTIGSQVVDYVGVARDVTERERAEEMLRESDRRLRESEERFRLAVRAANDIVWDYDVVHDVVTYGEGVSALTGFSQREINGSADWWRERVHPDDRPRIHDGIRKAVAEGQESWSDEYRIATKSGDWIFLRDRAQILRDADGQAVRFVGAVTDITERRQLEQQLSQSRRVASLGRVAASIAHEVNNVLMSIQPNVEVIRRRAPETLAPAVDRITRAVQRGKRITEQILSYTRSAPPRLETVDVRKFLRQWEDDVRPLLGSGVPVRLELPQTPLCMKADPLQIAQVLTNLALNARDAMSGKGGGSLTVIAERPNAARASFTRLMSPGDYVHFSVLDEGTGMTPEQLTQLFEPLYTTKSHGTGLGLAISYQLVSSHGGHIFAESEVGRGTIFHLFIPAAAPALVAMAETKVAPTGRRVVLVEDEEAVAFGVQSLLELDGIQVEVVDRGLDAVARIDSVHPDAVILDVGLPDIDGVTVYHEIEARWPDLPVVFSSGHADASKLESFLSRENVAFLLKPYGYDALLETMTTLLEKKRVA